MGRKWVPVERNVPPGVTAAPRQPQDWTRYRLPDARDLYGKHAVVVLHEQRTNIQNRQPYSGDSARHGTALAHARTIDRGYRFARPFRLILVSFRAACESIRNH
jgi:hypothetical protein